MSLLLLYRPPQPRILFARFEPDHLRVKKLNQLAEQLGSTVKFRVGEVASIRARKTNAIASGDGPFYQQEHEGVTVQKLNKTARSVVP